MHDLLLPLTGLVFIILAAVAASVVLAGKTADVRFGAMSGGLAIAGLFAPAAMILLPGLVHQHGFDALIPLVGLSGGLFLLVVLLAPAVENGGAVSLPALIGDRFGRLAEALVLIIALLVTASLLLGLCATAITLATQQFDATVGTAALILAAAATILALPAAAIPVLAATRLTALLTGVTFFAVLGIVSMAVVGNPVAPIAAGSAVAAIGPAELSLIEQGAVDFGVFKPYLRAFLTVDRLNWALLTLSLMAAVAVLPPLVRSAATFRRGHTARGLAWALTFVAIALTAVPAIAAFARLETYRAVATAETFAGLPEWIRRASELGAVDLHGTSLHLVDTVARDAAKGASGIDAVSAAMADRGVRAEARWQRLDPAVQEAVLDLARRFNAAPAGPPADRWTAYVDTVVTAAAAAAGNTTGKPDLAAVALDPHQLALALPHAAGLPPAVTAIMFALAFGSAAALAAVLLTDLTFMLVGDGSAALFGRRPARNVETALKRLLTIVLALVFALAAALLPVTADVVFVASFCLAAAGLLPVLILALWVPRASRFGAVAAIVVGLAISLYYLIGTSVFSVAFYETWVPLSSAGPEAYEEYEEARALWIGAEGDDRAAAYSDLAARTTGSLWSPGLANWFGIAPAAAPVLAIPAALLIGLLVSLVTRPAIPAPSSRSSNPEKVQN